MASVGKKVVVIGAGNVGCDVATEAARLGAEELTLLDVMEPASFGKEREDAEAAGAVFRWPVSTKEITDEGIVLDNNELIPEILALRAPAATMVLNCREDPLYTLPEMERADAILRETFERAGAAGRYRGLFYDGGHKFDRAMQADAFAWFDRFLNQCPDP